jgi:hypothetical protein
MWIKIFVEELFDLYNTKAMPVCKILKTTIVCQLGSSGSSPVGKKIPIQGNGAFGTQFNG